MRLSRKSDYALRALVFLACKEDPGPVSIRVLAEKNDIPYRFLQQITLDLKANGWIITLAGRDGGIQLAKEPHQITVGEVVRFFDGVLAPVGCVSIMHYEPCSQEPICRFRRMLLEIRNLTAAIMDRTTLADLVKNTPPSYKEVFGEQYIDGAGI